MGESHKVASKAQILSGWKEIARYLDKGLRTVQRYERVLGLPVRRPTGKPKGTMIATTAELDAWVMASPVREAFRLSNQLGSSVAAEAASLTRGIAEMHRLRHQMSELREELGTSVQVLKNILSEMSDDLHRNNLRERRKYFSVLEQTDRSSHTLELLEIDPRRKAS